MSKKNKIGKQRRDKYYKLAKEAGYRSRAAFKLLQLNKRFEFLQNARATVDLCAAPGGWMQVASQNMPVSSLVIGVDLAPIKAIPNCISLQGDITTEKTRQDIKKELNNWSADCVLHDGAPNVGQNWTHDAFQQNCLVLSALKLATQILKKNGTFVTKVFRSNDYSCLITTFEKLFKSVHVWKPAASRLESAEIFVVCEKYLKPAKVDPELLDTRKVFANPDSREEAKFNPQSLLVGNKKLKKTKAEGYETTGLRVFSSLPATEFILSPEYLELLGTTNEIILDQDKWKESAATKPEIVEIIKDLKVCGPGELRKLLKWRKAMIQILEDEKKDLQEEADSDDEDAAPLTEDDVEDQALVEIDEQIAKASEEEKAVLKKKKKRMLKAKAKIIKRRQLNMIIDGDIPDIGEDLEVFSLKRIRKARELQMLTSDNTPAPDYTLEDDEEVEGLGEGEWETRNGVLTADDDGDDDEIYNQLAAINKKRKAKAAKEEEGEEGSDDESDNELIHTEESGMNPDQKKASRADKWFESEDIAGLISDDDDEDEMNVIEKHMKRAGGLRANTVTFGEDASDKRQKRIKRKADNEDEFNKKVDDSSDEEADEEDELKKERLSRFTAEMDWEEQEVAEETNRASLRQPTKTILGENLKPKAKKRKLTPEELAMGEQLIYSGKKARELEEWGWNRYANNDDDLPDWFVEDERVHYKKMPPVTKAQVQEYKDRLKELNARPCKKVAEAKARKLRRTRSKMDRAKKRAEGIMENDGLEPSEKIREMKKAYAAANKKEERKVEYVKISKGKKGGMLRPEGRFKLVDSRMKKDLRAAKAKEKTKGRNGKKGGRSGPAKAGRGKGRR